jgi:hypothetical protein
MISSPYQKDDPRIRSHQVYRFITALMGNKRAATKWREQGGIEKAYKRMSEAIIDWILADASRQVILSPRR